MRDTTLRLWVLAGLALGLAVSAAACSDNNEEDREIRGSQLQVVSRPNPVHTVVDPTGTSDIEVTVTGLDSLPMAGAAVELSTMDGMLTTTMAVTDMAGMVTSTYSSSTVGFGTVEVRAVDTTVLHVIEITDREPDPSVPSKTHHLAPATWTITDCADVVSIDGQLLDSSNFAIQGASVVLAIRPMSADPVTLTGTFQNDLPSVTVTTGGVGLYSATFKLDPIECASCGSNLGDCKISLFATFTGDMGTYESDVNVNDMMVNDLVISTDLP